MNSNDNFFSFQPTLNAEGGLIIFKRLFFCYHSKLLVLTQACELLAGPVWWAESYFLTVHFCIIISHTNTAQLVSTDLFRCSLKPHDLSTSRAPPAFIFTAGGLFGIDSFYR